MEKYRAIPKGYMTVGEAAKKMNTTVRTLQYYDKEGLLSPSSESKGGRRLYTDKDIIKHHQIMSMKYLGFSLDDIKNRLSSLDTPADVAAALTDQGAAIREKIEVLSESLKAIEALKAEVLQMQSVDFKKYADIIVNLQMGNEMYWMIKHFDETIIEHVQGRFDKESSLAMMDTFSRLWNEAIQFQKDNVPPDSQKGQELVKEFWDLLMEFTGGDISLISKLNELSENTGGLNSEWKEKQVSANDFLEPALEAYFATLGHNPFEEESK